VAQSEAARLLDQLLHQGPTQSLALQFRAQQNRVFTRIQFRVGMNLRNAEHFVIAVDGQQHDHSRIVDLGQAGDKGLADVFHRGEVTLPQIVGRDVGKEATQSIFVLGTHRTHVHIVTVPQRQMGFE